MTNNGALPFFHLNKLSAATEAHSKWQKSTQKVAQQDGVLLASTVHCIVKEQLQIEIATKIKQIFKAEMRTATL